MRIVSVCSSDGKSVRPSIPHVNGGMRTASRILSNAAHQRIPSGITNAVSSKLSRSDFVQWRKVGKGARLALLHFHQECIPTHADRDSNRCEKQQFSS